MWACGLAKMNPQATREGWEFRCRVCGGESGCRDEFLCRGVLCLGEGEGGAGWEFAWRKGGGGLGVSGLFIWALGMRYGCCEGEDC
jgi:hypothetical protein